MNKLLRTITVLIVALCIGVVTVNALNNDNSKLVSFLDNKNITVNYKEKMKINTGTSLNGYLDKDKNEYYYDGNDLVVYIKNTDNYVITKNSSDTLEVKVEKIEDYKTNAINYASKLMKKETSSNNISTSSNSLNEVLSKYELTTSNYIEDYNEYSYTFTKKIGKYLVNDGIMIGLDDNGELTSFVGTQQGLYDGLTDLRIDENEVEKFINETMKTQYSNYISYKIDNEFINFIDKKFVLQINIEMSHSDNTYSTTTLYYDLEI